MKVKPRKLPKITTYDSAENESQTEKNPKQEVLKTKLPLSKKDHDKAKKQEASSKAST